MKVTSTSCSGLRLILMRARHASVVIWRERVANRYRRLDGACGRSGRGGWDCDGCGHDALASVSGYGGFTRVAGQGEEHLVEARLLDGGARDIELVVPQRDEDVGSLVGVAQRDAES